MHQPVSTQKILAINMVKKNQRSGFFLHKTLLHLFPPNNIRSLLNIDLYISKDLTKMGSLKQGERKMIDIVRESLIVMGK